MALRQIIHADNPRLREKSRKVRVFGPGLQTLIDDMIETMHENNGLGLAAPQVDVRERVVVIELPEQDDDQQSGQVFALVNPEIIRAEGEEEGEEGCLSIPGWWGEVKRATAVTVKAQDAKGKWMRIKGYDLLARALQHEIDHLDGVLFIDRVEGPEKLHRVEPKTDGAAEDEGGKITLSESGEPARDQPMEREAAETVMQS
jgi:peptide deformylase